MKYSKKGTWIIENPKFKYMVYIEKAEIVEVWGYMFGFNKVEVKVRKAFSQKENSFIDITYPDYHFYKITASNKEDLMIYILKHHLHHEPTANKYITERLNSYRNHLIENFPEKII